MQHSIWKLPCLALTCVLSCIMGCGGNSGVGSGSALPPPTITLTLVGPYNVTLGGTSWVVAGGPTFTLVATGTGFTSSSVIQWNGSPLATQFGSSTGLVASVSSNLVATPGTAAITVTDSGTTSNSLPFGIASPAAATAGVVAMVTVATDGTPANNDSLVAPSISSTGRYVAFQSAATNLGAGVTSTYQQIYERDTCIGATAGCVPTTIPISVTYDGSAVNDNSRNSTISGDGRYVAFDSSATNITNFTQAQTICPIHWCSYLRDTCIGVSTSCTPRTTLISLLPDGSPTGGEGPSISPDGRFIAFTSPAPPGPAQIYVYDTCNGASPGCATSTSLISQSSSGQPGNNTSETQSVSAGGRYVAFASGATNYISDDTNVGNLDLYLRDTCTGATIVCTPTTAEEDISTSGAQAAGQLDVESNPALSSDGRFLAFSTLAYNLVSQPANVFGGIYLRDTCNGTALGCTPMTSLVGVANDGSLPNAGGNNTSISATGRYIAFASLASNLVPGDTFTPNSWKDIFVRDTCFGVTTGCSPSTVRVSVSNWSYLAQQSNAINDYPRISADGHYVVFLSASTNYLSSSSNGNSMVYLARTGF
jgi:Tol biopolymer transport system component